VDPLLGLKENVIIGKLIPAGTGLARYRNIKVKPKHVGMSLLEEVDALAAGSKLPEGAVEAFFGEPEYVYEGELTEESGEELAEIDPAD